MERVVSDCRRFESESDCTLTIIGEEEEVIRAAAEHAVSVHHYEDSPEFREQLRATLEPERDYMSGERQRSPIPFL